MEKVLEKSFFESVGLINNLNSSNFAYSNFVIFAINKLKECIMILENFKNNIENISVQEAKEHLSLLDQYDAFLKTQKKEMLQLNGHDFVTAKNISMQYLNSLLETREMLEEIVIDDNLGRMITEEHRNMEYSTPEESMLWFEELKKRTNEIC